MKRLICAALAATISGVSSAGFVDGNLLQKRAKDDGDIDFAYAIGYVVGVADMGDGEEFCLPVNFSAGQALDIAKNFLQKYPDLRHYNAALLVSASLKQKFPCQKKGTGL